jgi:hypothetical protein
VIEDRFINQVVVNQGKSGGYFSVGSLTEAPEGWESVVPCE